MLEYIGRGVNSFAGSLPLAKAVRGNVSDDPRVEEDFFADRKFTSISPSSAYMYAGQPHLSIMLSRNAPCRHWSRVSGGHD